MFGKYKLMHLSTMDWVSACRHNIDAYGNTIVFWTTSPGWADMPGGKGREAYLSYNDIVINRL
jgi:hypothetical protein